MSTVPDPLVAWDNYEKTCLAVFSIEEHWLRTRINSFYLIPLDAPELVEQILVELRSHWNTLSNSTRRQIADELSNQGRELFGRRLEALMQYVNNQINNFTFAYRSKLAFRAALGRPPFSPLPQPTEQPDFIRPWTSVFFRRCIYCGCNMENLYFVDQVICPACGRFPRPV
jgi:hypothetical protein